MAFRWSEETTFKFVNKYVQHECLWNVKSLCYKNKQMKQSAYIDIEKAMNIPGFSEKEIKLKIKNIRSTYSQELKKIKESKLSGDDQIYTPSLKWFKLIHHYLRNISTVLADSEGNLEYDPTLSIIEAAREPSISITENALEEIISTPPTKKQKRTQPSSIVSHLQDINEATNYTAEDNEFDIFGKHVSVQLKKLPFLMALEAQEHIQLYLNKIRRQHIEKNIEKNNDSYI